MNYITEIKKKASIQLYFRNININIHHSLYLILSILKIIHKKYL